MKGRKLSADAFVLAGLLLLLAVLSTRIAGQGAKNTPEGPNPRRTVTSTRPGGWKAAYLLLQRSGVPVRRFEKAPQEWPKKARVIVSGDEYFALSGGGVGAAFWDAGEVDAALRWVEGGGTLVLFMNRASEMAEELGLEAGEHQRKDAVVTPLQPAPYLSGVRQVFLPGKDRWVKKPAGAVTLYGDAKPAVVAIRQGSGRIVAVSSSAIIDNTNLAKADNARFLVEVAAAFGARGQPVLFDEYHQGFQEQASFWTAVGRPGQLAFYQFAALMLLVCYSAGVRFGLPRPLAEGSRVSSEYVASLANLYRRARAADAALESVYLSFWRDLCRAVGLPLDTDTPEVARRAAATLGDATMTTSGAVARRSLQERLESLLARAEANIEAGPKRFQDRDLLGLVRELEEMRKELGLGRDDDNAGSR